MPPPAELHGRVNGHDAPVGLKQGHDLLGQPRHAQVAGSVYGPAEKRVCLLSVARLTARQEHARVVVLCVRDPRPGTHVCIHSQRVLEMPLRVLPPLHRGGEEAQVARRGAVAGDPDANNDVSPAVRKKDLVQGVGAAGIA